MGNNGLFARFARVWPPYSPPPSTALFVGNRRRKGVGGAAGFGGRPRPPPPPTSSCIAAHIANERQPSRGHHPTARLARQGPHPRAPRGRSRAPPPPTAPPPPLPPP